MNIHRKDRAKLREFSNDNNLLSLAVSDHPRADDDDGESASLQRLDSGDEQAAAGCPSERPPPCVVAKDGDDHVPKGKINGREDPLLLPLFVETPSPANNGKESCSVVRDVPTGVQLSDNGATTSASPPALDLELRLGVEPHQQHDPEVNLPPINQGLGNTSYTNQE